jgi:chemotaxis protein MotB
MQPSNLNRLDLLALLAAASLLAGCSQNPLVLQGRVEKLQTQSVAMQNQNEQLQIRTNSLDHDNQDLETSLAQSHQRSKILEDQLGQTQQQLTDITAKWENERKAKEQNAAQVKTMTASLQRRGSVSIQPNRSVRRSLPVANIPGLSTYKTGDEIRIPIPADRLFDSRSNRFRPGADKLITQVAGVIRQKYPQQKIGIEGFTDTQPITGGVFRNHHELSVAQALAVGSVLGNQGGIDSKRLIITGRGSAVPKRSNGTDGGGTWNNRVEIVIHPESADL